MASKLNASQAMRKLKIFHDYYAGKLTDEDIKKRRIEDLRDKHPDKGGDADEFVLTKQLWDRVMKYLEDKKLAEANKCPKCSGTGWYEGLVGGFQSKVRCPACKGKGVKNV